MRASLVIRADEFPARRLWWYPCRLRRNRRFFVPRFLRERAFSRLPQEFRAARRDCGPTKIFMRPHAGYAAGSGLCSTQPPFTNLSKSSQGLQLRSKSAGFNPASASSAFGFGGTRRLVFGVILFTGAGGCSALSCPLCGAALIHASTATAITGNILEKNFITPPISLQLKFRMPFVKSSGFLICARKREHLRIAI